MYIKCLVKMLVQKRSYLERVANLIAIYIKISDRYKLLITYLQIILKPFKSGLTPNSPCLKYNETLFKKTITTPR